MIIIKRLQLSYTSYNFPKRRPQLQYNRKSKKKLYINPLLNSFSFYSIVPHSKYCDEKFVFIHITLVSYIIYLEFVFLLNFLNILLHHFANHFLPGNP